MPQTDEIRERRIVNTKRSLSMSLRGIMPLCIALSLSDNSAAQFGLGNPDVMVTLRHAPGLGLQIKRVAFIGSSGECSERLEDQLMEILAAGGVEVIERQQFKTLLAEQAIANSDVIDTSSSVRLGKLLGPTALISIKVYRCSTDQQSLVSKGVTNKIKFVSKTTAELRGSVRTIDLTTGKIFRPLPLEETVPKQHSSAEGPPEFPSRVQVEDEAIKRGAQKAGRLFVPWTDPRKVVFFDDEDCQLKTAFRLLKAGDIGKALEHSLQNLEQCKSSAKKPKVVAHAYYNAGLLYLLREEYDKAAEYLQEAIRNGGAKQAESTLQEARSAKMLAAEIKRVEQMTDKPSITKSNGGPDEKSPETAQPKPTTPEVYLALDDEIGTILKVTGQGATFTIPEGTKVAIGDTCEVRRPETVTDPRTKRQITIADQVGTITVRDLRSTYLQGDVTGKVEVNDRVVKPCRPAATPALDKKPASSQGPKLVVPPASGTAKSQPKPVGPPRKP